jgi:hypothetical protein
MDRPALDRLLQDIKAHRIDTVVVYKVDRLTRSLRDFAKIVDVFDQHGVSFVSVTQQFNTTTSMGRLTLNMLLSFAQFEREVIFQRIMVAEAIAKHRAHVAKPISPLRALQPGTPRDARRVEPPNVGMQDPVSSSRLKKSDSIEVRVANHNSARKFGEKLVAQISERWRPSNHRFIDPMDRYVNAVEIVLGIYVLLHSSTTTPSWCETRPIWQIEAMSAFAVSTSIAMKFIVRCSCSHGADAGVGRLEFAGLAVARSFGRAYAARARFARSRS